MSTFFARKGALTEDALTGSLHDLLAWWSVPNVVKGLLARVCAFDGERVDRARRLPLPTWESYEIEAWPTRPSGEPDLVLRLFEQGTQVATVVIEVKLGAEKSSVESAESGTRDQLEKYYSDLRREGVATRVVYLTDHAAAPHGDLRASWNAIANRTPDAGPDHLGWTSWADVDACLRDESFDAPDAFLRAAGSMRTVLTRHDLCHCTGEWRPRSTPPLGEPPSALFYGLFRWKPDGVGAPESAPASVFYR